MAQFNTRKDYYKILRVDEDATEEEINKTYRQEASKRHPDRGGNEEDMKSLNEAYSVLGNKSSRKEYDIERGIRAARKDRDETFRETTPSFDFESVAARSSDTFGLGVAALICLGFGIPILLLIETQWVFFLWPLRIIAVGIILIGIYLARATFRQKQHDMMAGRAGLTWAQSIGGEIVFWLFVALTITMFYMFMEAVGRN
jgi:hypothetical protein